MTLLLLETNILIDAERSALDLDGLIADDDEPAVAAITIAELGVETATGKRRQARRAFLDDIVETMKIVSYDLDVARTHTKLLLRYAQQVDREAPTISSSPPRRSPPGEPS